MNNKKRIIKTLITVVLALVMGFGGYYVKENADEQTAQSGDALSVYFIDVGQGDCEFVVLPDGKSLLIDAGEAENAESVEEKINSIGYEKLDYVVVTHPHTDHMGAMAEIISDMEVGSIYMPNAVSSTRTYENLLETITAQNLSVTKAKAGVNICSGDGFSVDLLAPVSENYEETNNYSVVVKITYNKSSYLFMGDAEELVEDELLESEYQSLDSDVLKVGHHGSRTSSSKEFLSAVSPDYAVIECSSDNSYGHPHSQTLSRLENVGADVYITASSSDILISTNGQGTYQITKNCFDDSEHIVL